MKTFALLSLALTAALILSGCKSEVSYNQRLTVIVETPAGEVRGSAVTRVTDTDTTGSIFVPPEASRVSSKVVGEAVAIEVTPGRWLFALLDGREDGLGGAAYLSYPAFGLDKALDRDGQHTYDAAVAQLLAQPLDTPGTIPPSDYPLMVTFDDIAKPETVRLVDPADLAASFRPGVALKAVTLEVTEDAVTGGRVEGVLGWWCRILNPTLYPEMDVQLTFLSGCAWRMVILSGENNDNFERTVFFYPCDGFIQPGLWCWHC